MFAMLGNREHGERRKTVSNSYSKAYVLSPPVEQLLQNKVHDFLRQIASQSTCDVFSEYHFLGLDVISTHVYGPDVGTKALLRKGQDHTLLDDFIRYPKSAWLWCLVHFPGITERASTPGDILNTISRALGIVRKNLFPYTSMRHYAYDSTIQYLNRAVGTEQTSVMSKMIKFHISQGGAWSDKDLAAEAGDHTIAGFLRSEKKFLTLRRRYDGRDINLSDMADFSPWIPTHPRKTPSRNEKCKHPVQLGRFATTSRNR